MATRSVGAPHPTWLPWLWLSVGVVAASISAILIRYAGGAEPLALSFWRCAAGAIILVPFTRFHHVRGERSSVRLPVVAGVFLAVHFATWITSLELTSVAASVLLVSTSSVVVAFVSWWLMGEPLRPPVWFGIALAMAGTAVIARSDLSESSLAGNLLTLARGLTVGGYVLAGQVARRTMGIAEYSVIAYSVAGILLLAACVVADAPLWGYDGRTWLAIAGLIVGPQLLGHTVINFVLKDIDATTVSVAVMAEPVIATALAFVLFSEVPSLLIYPGGAAILAGIYLVSTSKRPTAVVVE